MRARAQLRAVGHVSSDCCSSLQLFSGAIGEEMLDEAIDLRQYCQFQMIVVAAEPLEPRRPLAVVQS